MGRLEFTRQVFQSTLNHVGHVASNCASSPIVDIELTWIGLNSNGDWGFGELR